MKVPVGPAAGMVASSRNIAPVVLTGGLAHRGRSRRRIPWSPQWGLVFAECGQVVVPRADADLDSDRDWRIGRVDWRDIAHRRAAVQQVQRRVEEAACTQSWPARIEMSAQ
jgi:hypothetical protein